MALYFAFAKISSCVGDGVPRHHKRTINKEGGLHRNRPLHKGVYKWILGYGLKLDIHQRRVLLRELIQGHVRESAQLNKSNPGDLNQRSFPGPLTSIITAARRFIQGSEGCGPSTRHKCSALARRLVPLPASSPVSHRGYAASPPSFSRLAPGCLTTRHTVTLRFPSDSALRFQTTP